jgi:hypothetical protein
MKAITVEPRKPGLAHWDSRVLLAWSARLLHHVRLAAQQI